MTDMTITGITLLKDDIKGWGLPRSNNRNIDNCLYTLGYFFLDKNQTFFNHIKL